MKQLIFLFSCMLFLASCNIAPWSESYDFFIFIGIFIVGCSIPLYKAIKAYNSGSYYWETNSLGQRIEKIYTGKKIPIYKIAWFQFFLCVFFGLLFFFFFLLWPDSHDVWFPSK